MAEKSQAEKDTKRAKSRQGNGSQAEKDSARAKSRQKGGGGSSSMDQRERAAGIYLAGNDTTSGRGQPDQTFREREQAAGLYNSTLGRARGKRDFNAVTRSKEYQRRIDAAAEAEQVGTAQGNIDFTSTNQAASSGGSGLGGIEIIWADESETFISVGEILEDYDDEDYWSVVFYVNNNRFDQDYGFDDAQELWDDKGEYQTEYRLRVKTLNDDNDPTSISAYGQYREVIMCVSGKPVTSLIKIS